MLPATPPRFAGGSDASESTSTAPENGLAGSDSSVRSASTAGSNSGADDNQANSPGSPASHYRDSGSLDKSAAAAADAMSGVFAWAVGRIKEKVTSQIIVDEDEVNCIVGVKAHEKFEVTCETLGKGTANLHAVVSQTENLIRFRREATFQRFKVGTALSNFAQLEFDRGDQNRALGDESVGDRKSSFAKSSDALSSTDSDTSWQAGGSLIGDGPAAVASPAPGGTESASSLAAAADSKDAEGSNVSSKGTMSSPSLSGTKYPGDVAMAGLLMEMLADLENDANDSLVQRFLAPLKQSSNNIAAAQIIIKNRVRLIEELGRARAGVKFYADRAAKAHRAGMSPATTRKADEEAAEAKIMELAAKGREDNSIAQLKFLVANFPGEVQRMRSECTKLLHLILLEHARAQVAHEKSVQDELVRVQQALRGGDGALAKHDLAQYHRWRDVPTVAPPLPGSDTLHERAKLGEAGHSHVMRTFVSEDHEEQDRGDAGRSGSRGASPSGVAGKVGDLLGSVQGWFSK